jgi:hypothetical protein
MNVKNTTLSAFCMLVSFGLPLMPLFGQDGVITEGHIFGFTRAPRERAPETYNAGFSIYVAAWPLLREYPGSSFQSGLFGTWMHPEHDTPVPEKLIAEYGMKRLYCDIEGGLGWWRATRFATETPKFVMGGVALNFSAWANGPGAGKGRDWNNPKGHYGVAQLSPWVLWPPDGLNLKQGTCGELFGYGYVPLPFTEPKSTTAGKNVPTDNQCWTLFLNTRNFKGPVAFFTPYFWSTPSVKDPRLAGMFLDTLPSSANKQLSMETQHIHCASATDSKGQTYLRMAQTQFPAGPHGESLIIQQCSVYNRKTLWDGVKSWFEGGKPVDGTIGPEGTFVQKFTGEVGCSWGLRGARLKTDFMSGAKSDPLAYRLKWDNKIVKTIETPHGSLVVFPEYWKLLDGQWVAVDAEDVPAETGLSKITFKDRSKASEPYVTPDDPESCWKKPGPVAGPFKAQLGDGSTVTYYWYRFADQPTMLNADMTDVEREALQTRVEKLHRHWTKDRDYLAPPKVGTLAEIDPALMVTPPKGLEVGYVPIATRQEAVLD